MNHSIVKHLHVLINQSILLVNGKVEFDFYLILLRSTVPVKGIRQRAENSAQKGYRESSRSA